MGQSRMLYPLYRLTPLTCWKSESGALVMVRRATTKTVFFESLKSEDRKVEALNPSDFTATFPIEVV